LTSAGDIADQGTYAWLTRSVRNQLQMARRLAMKLSVVLSLGTTIFLVLSVSAPAQDATPKDQPTAAASFIDAAGKVIGSATLTETPHGVIIRAELEGLTPGEHSMHIHATGKCEGAKFESAGGHFNPNGSKHGFMLADGPHAGDMPNQFVGEDGKLSVNVLNAMISIGSSDVEDKNRSSVIDEDGSALVIHAGADDYLSQPSGNAGDRIACGVIEPAPK
jgi:Cu-Zn family superoxide dismutase